MPRVSDEDIRLQTQLDSPCTQSVSYRVGLEPGAYGLALLGAEEWRVVGTLSTLDGGGFLAEGPGIPSREFGDAVQAARWMVECR